MFGKQLIAKLFGMSASPASPAAPAVANEAGGTAHALSAEQALAQFAATGCLQGTFYADEAEQLAAVLELAARCEPRFVAQVAVFARERGCMKELPALLCAVLAARDGALLAQVFPRVVDSATMLRNFVRHVRSGQAGRRSLGTLPRRLVREWLAARTDAELLTASIGTRPSLVDVIRMVHPKPATPARDALYRWLLGKPHERSLLPAVAVQFDDWLRDGGELPAVDFRLLTSRPLSGDQWRTIAQRAGWTALRMNLNTFHRHGVFACAETTASIARRLADPVLQREARAFPYQVMTTLMHLHDGVPAPVRAALHSALETATTGVPTLPGRTVVAIDVSGSMHSPATGRRRGASSAATCLDVAALFAAALLRRNRDCRVIPFHDDVCAVDLDPYEPVFAIGRRLRELPSGGTNCSAVLAHLNARRERADTVVYLSDNQSWVDGTPGGRSTAMLAQWRTFRRRNRGSRLVCIDLQPYLTVQVPAAEDVTHVGGFSDHVFEVVAAVAGGGRGQDHWVERIRQVAIDAHALSSRNAGGTTSQTRVSGLRPR